MWYVNKTVIVEAIKVTREKKKGKILFILIQVSKLPEFKLNQSDLDNKSITAIIMTLQIIQAINVHKEFIAIDWIVDFWGQNDIKRW